MKSLCRLLVVAFLAASPAGFAACGGSGKGAETRPASPEIVAGVYTSTAFIEPGQNDAGVDLNAGGGYLNVTLSADYKVEGRLVVPEGAGSNYDGVQQAFSGTWKPSGSGVLIEGTNTLIDGHEWTCGSGTLETSGGGRGPFTIRLQKMHDVPVH